LAASGSKRGRAAGAPRLSAAPLIGRRPELDWLRGRLSAAIGGVPQVVLIAGEPGIGKSRLVGELYAAANECGAQVYCGRCSEERTFPYWPFREALLPSLVRQTAPAVPSTPDALSIARLLQHDTAFSSQPAAPAQADHDRTRLFRAVARATLALAQERPLLLVVEDLHWADASSLDLFEHLAFAVSDAAGEGPVPLLLVATHRPVERETPLGRALNGVAREPICEVLQLHGLGEADVAELIRHLSPGRPSRQLVRALNQATLGNPLFVQELMHHLERRTAFRKRAGYVVADVSAGDLQFPDSVVGAIAARIQGLSEGCRRVLTVAALLGDGGSLQVLSRASAVSLPDLEGRLEEARTHHVLTLARQAFQFAHPLIRHVFYSQPSIAQRQRLHQQIAACLEDLYAGSLQDHVIEIAHHLAAAGPAADVDKILRYARAAGDQAFSMFAWAEAARYYEAVLESHRTTERFAAADVADLHYRAGFARYRDMDVGPAVDHYESAITAYRAAGDVRGVAHVLIEITRTRFSLAAVSYGTLIDIAPLEDLLGEIGDDEPALRGRILAIMAEAYWHARRTDQATSAARRALEIGQRMHDAAVCTHAGVALGLAQMQTLQPRAAVESYREALAHARRTDDLWLQGWPLGRLPIVLAALGHLDEAHTVAGEACDLTRRTSDWAEHSLALAAHTTVAAVKGEFEAVEQFAHDAMTMVRRSRYPWGGAAVLCTLAGTRCLRGQFAEAQDAVDMLVESGRIFDDPGPAMHLLAWVYGQLMRAYAGQAEEVRGQLAGLPLSASDADRSDINALAGFCALVEAADLVAAPALTVLPYEVLSAAAERGVVFSTGWVFLLRRILGVAAALQRRWDEAEAHYRAAIAAATHAGAQPELGRSSLDYARLLADRGRPADRLRAIDLLLTAQRIFATLGMEPCRRRALRLAEALHARLPAIATPSARPAGALGGPETALLAGVARGRGDEDIAEELVVSPMTARRMMNALFDKLGVEGRAAATTYAQRTGLVPYASSASVSATQSAGPQGPLLAGEPLVILFTDLAESTALIERLGDAKAQEVLRAHDAIIQACLQGHSGSKVKHTGDGIMASFPSAFGAIQCAIAIQRALARHNRAAPQTPMKVRIGINAGAPMVEDGQLFGAAVNAARRICDHAEPEQILVSNVVRQLAAGRRIAFQNRGQCRLKGFSEPFRLYAVQWRDVDE
jgi:class 3 adenylate cyclase/tetratricopeptide (TPR) repeat protein